MLYITQKALLSSMFNVVLRIAKTNSIFHHQESSCMLIL